VTVDRQALLTALTTEHFTLQGALFSLALIPVLFWLGLLTYVRVLEKSIEDLFYARAINRIRHYYLQLAGRDAGYFLHGGNDDVVGVFSNMATTPSRAQLLYSSASTIGVVNSVVGGSGIALLLGAIADASPGLAVACGALAAGALVLAHLAHERRTFTCAFQGMDVAFPSARAPGR
jgi:hypothetical protein